MKLKVSGSAPRKQRKTEFGGSFSAGKRKKYRPLCTQRSLHIVLKSDRAKGFRSLNNNAAIVKRVIKKAASLFHIRVYSYALNHNHIHLNIKGRNREDVQNFFRVLAGHIAQEILRRFPIPIPPPSRSAGGAPKEGKNKRKFWNELIYSRIVSWGREFRTVLKYIETNRLEALGMICRLEPDRNRSKAHDMVSRIV